MCFASPHPGRALSPLLLCGLLCLALAGGCDEAEEVAVYTIPKEPAPPAIVIDPHAGHDHGPGEHTDHDHPVQPTERAAGGQDLGRVNWEVPEEWRQIPGQRPMRVATFEVGEGEGVMEIVVSVFPGDTGGLLANVNRWRGQIGLAPVAEAELSSVVEAFEGAGVSGHTMRMSGPGEHLVGAAIYEAALDRTWFVKAVGPPAVVEAHASVIEAFSRSFSSVLADPAAGAGSVEGDG